MKKPITRYEKIRNKISEWERKQRDLRTEYIIEQQNLASYCKKHRSLSYDTLETRDTEKLWKIYEYFDKKYPIDFQGGIRCDERGMKVCFWLDDDPEYLILHIASTSQNICFSGSTSWLVKAPTLEDKVEILKTIKQDIWKIIK